MKFLFEPKNENLAPATGIINGLILGLICWSVIGFFVYLIWRYV